MIKAAYHPRMGSLYLLYSTALYESVDGGNRFIKKVFDGLPESYELKELIFQNDNDRYSVHALDKATKRYELATTTGVIGK